MVDYGQIFRANPNWAIPVPALSPYLAGVWRQLHKNPTRAAPAGITLDDLNILQRRAGLYHLDKVLYSAGLAAGGNQPDVITDRPNHDAEVIEDSGGFQVATGTIKWATDKWLMKLLPFAEKYCDWCPTADCPTGAIAGNARFAAHKSFLLANGGYDPRVVSGVPADTLHTLGAVNGLSDDFNACLITTKHNTEWILDHRGNAPVRWMNVAQGRSVNESLAWYDVMSGYDAFEGLCFPATHLVRLEQPLYWLVRLLKRGVLQRYGRIHFLGTGAAQNLAIYSTILEQLRLHVPNITITADVANAVKGIEKGELVIGITLGEGMWEFQRINTDNLKSYPPTMTLKSALFQEWRRRYFHITKITPAEDETDRWFRFAGDRRFFIKTEIAKRITVGEFIIAGAGKHDLDALSNFCFYNHNIQAYTEGAVIALKHYDAETPDLMHPALKRTKEAIRSVFATQDEREIFANRHDLNILEEMDQNPMRRGARL